MSENELSARDEAVRAKLLERITELRELANLREEEAREARREADRIENAAHAEEWWKLERILGAEVTESLSTISPTNLLDAP